MRRSKYLVFGLLALMTVGGVTVQALGPANVISPDTNLCGIGWFGCSSDIAILQPDGSYAYPAFGLVLIDSVPRGAYANDAHGNVEFSCHTQIVFGGLNTATDGTEVAALPLESVCLFLPDACQGNGSLIANTRTVGGLATCIVNGVPTTDMQEVVSPTGRVSLKCSLPDPPQGD